MVPQIQGPNILDVGLQNDEFGNNFYEFDITWPQITYECNVSSFPAPIERLLSAY